MLDMVLSARVDKMLKEQYEALTPIQQKQLAI